MWCSNIDFSFKVVGNKKGSLVRQAHVCLDNHAVIKSSDI